MGENEEKYGKKGEKQGKMRGKWEKKIGKLKIGEKWEIQEKNGEMGKEMENIGEKRGGNGFLGKKNGKKFWARNR